MCGDSYRLDLANVFQARLAAGRVVVNVAADLPVLGQAPDDRLPFPALFEWTADFTQIHLLFAVRIGQPASVGNALRVGRHIHGQVCLSNRLANFLLQFK